MFWPIWIALTSAGLAVTWFTDRTAFYGFLTVLCGLLAMRMPSSFPPLFALTVWSTAAAIHIYLTNQSIVACVLSIILALFYIPAVFGWPWLSAAFWSDVAGVLLLVSLVAPTAANWVGADRSRFEYLYPGPVPTWGRAAIQALGKAQKSATPEAMRQDLP